MASPPSGAARRPAPSSPQLALDLACDPAFGREDFLVSASNEKAYAMIELWPRWPDHALLILGRRGAGKSHLGAIWAARAGAAIIPADALTGGEAVAGDRPLLIEDLETTGPGETALFHLLNRMRESGAGLLLTAQTPPETWSLRTPDLLSRLRRAPSVEIGLPDDALMRAVLVKLLIDRQLVIDTSVVEYAALRLDRSLDAARAFINALDREALARQRRITRKMAGDVLDALALDAWALDESSPGASSFDD